MAALLAFTAAALSIIGISITGFYPGILVLAFIALVTAASRLYAGKASGKNGRFFLPALTIINFLSLLVVLWMSFVIVHDRVLHDCC